jgi:peptide/nickel transport system permease protein
VHEIAIRLPLSVQLAIMATLIALVLSVPLGVLAAVKQDTWVDYAVRVFSVGGLSMPSFWLGIVILLGLLIAFRWSPPIVFTPLWQNPLANLSQLIWPAMAVGYRYTAMVTRMTRSSALEVLREDYVRTARAKGLRERVVVARHAMRNAMLPVVTVVGLEFAFLLGGLIVTEQVFNLNGIGKLTVEAVLRRDYTMTQALILLLAGAFVFVNFVVDLLYVWLDPRISYD